MASEFVIVDGEGFEGFAASSDLPEGEFVEALRQGIDKEEVMILFNKQKYEEDMKGTALASKEGLWRQFKTDLKRQMLTVDGHEASKLPMQKVAEIMEGLVLFCHKKREAWMATRVKSEPEPVKQSIWSFAWLYDFLAKYIPTIGAAPVKTTGFIPETDSMSTYVMVPSAMQLQAAHEAASFYGQSLMSGMPPKDVMRHSLRKEGEVETPTQCMEDTSPCPPRYSPEFPEHLSEQVDTLALFCQQGVLGAVFSLVNNQYQSHECNIFISDGGRCPMKVDVSYGLNDAGAPDVLIKIEKVFKLFQIAPEGETKDLCCIAVGVDATLFSSQMVSLVMKVHKAN
eukprot:TRINITY_DN3626_c0_g1_i1.p1 TRINITY_DN3626_c0_g1~~TRINITY_DN3626_c0_g1_i1.p1  ORF type:complete len:361 (+),score=86.17 TRINITY_DN3626_c0_g1_i1:62-1084(+)